MKATVKHETENPFDMVIVIPKEGNASMLLLEKLAELKMDAKHIKNDVDNGTIEVFVYPAKPLNLEIVRYINDNL